MPKRQAPAKATLPQCKALYARLVKATLAHFIKLGFKTTLAELRQHYRLEDARTYRHCLGLTKEQLACVQKQPNPLASRKRCKHDRYLFQEIPKAVKERLFPPPRPLDAATAKRTLARLRGRWKRVFYGGATHLTVGADGQATSQEYASGKPKGPPRRYRFSLPAAYRITRESKKWATITGVLFLPDRNTLFWSENQAYTVQPVKRRNSFCIRLTRGSLITFNGKSCESLDTMLLWYQQPRCGWKKDRRAKLPVFEVRYAYDDRTNHVTFHYLKGHLLRSGLFHNRWRRR